MSTYQHTVTQGSASLKLSEQHLYGSSRMGMRTPEEEMIGAQLPDDQGLFEIVRGMKRYELTNHLGNVLSVITDTKQAVYDNPPTVLSYYQSTVISYTDYYPFGAPMDHGNSADDQSWSGGYRYGVNGMEKDDEVNGGSMHIDYGARGRDPRLGGGWWSADPMAQEYPGISPYAFVMNTPLCAVDPDGKLVLFIGGLRLLQGAEDQPFPVGSGEGMTGIYQSDVFNYWSTDYSRRYYSSNGQNSFGRPSDIAEYFTHTIGDYNDYFTSGSSDWSSQADQRQDEGAARAAQFHAMVQSGQIVLSRDETIKIVSHSQGGAHAAGFVEALHKYLDKDGNRLYNVEVIYYITPHQPGDIDHPNGVRGVQYSHPSDAVSSASPWWLPNGGSEFADIPGELERVMGDIMGGDTGTPCEGPAGNRCGHNVTDNDQFIRDSGTVKQRND